MMLHDSVVTVRALQKVQRENVLVCTFCVINDLMLQGSWYVACSGKQLK